MKPSLVIFTEFYPYGKGEEFLQDELFFAEKNFSKILIVCFKKKPLFITKYVPANAEIVAVRENISNRSLLFKRLSTVFTLDYWKQVYVCLKERGLSSLREGLISVLLEQSKLDILLQNEIKWAGKYDIYYSYWLAGGASYLALRKQTLNGKVVSRAHGYDCFYERGFHPHRLEQFKNLDAIFPISESGGDDLVRQGCNPEIIHIQKLGVIRKDYITNPHVINRFRTIVSCSNIVDIKRLDLLVEALAQVDDCNIKWIHFGDGVLKNHIEVLARERLARKKNITYDFKGWVKKEDIFQFYASKSVDAFINCSDAEGIPVSVMEAMSFGIPCIARNVGGNSEVVKDGINGLLLSRECKPESISSAIRLLLHLTEEEYERLRTGASQTYKDNYNAEKNYESFYSELIGI